METLILRKLFISNGIQDILPIIQIYVDEYKNKCNDILNNKSQRRILFKKLTHEYDDIYEKLKILRDKCHILSKIVDIENRIKHDPYTLTINGYKNKENDELNNMYLSEINYQIKQLRILYCC